MGTGEIPGYLSRLLLNERLGPFKREELELDLCPVCGGLWLDRTEFHVMTTEANVYKEESVSEEYSRPAIPQKEEIHPLLGLEEVVLRGTVQEAVKKLFMQDFIYSFYYLNELFSFKSTYLI